MFVAGGLLVLAGLAVYANSFSGPFVFDDTYSIPLNGTIRQLATALAPPGNGTTVSGRPLLNLSFALNYAVSGLNVWSYHALNLLIHLLAGLTLFGIVRRTFALASMGERLRGRALFLAFAIALLWLIHPLQTESVTYIVQRSESLMGLFYLLTLYCFIRGATGGQPGVWIPLSVLACLLGMGTKEVTVSAPVLLLLYDRTFLAGTFRAAWRRRRGWYLGLAATWLPLGWLVVGAANRGGTAGFGVGVGFWQYAATQFEAVARYLWLALWPHPLIVDYGAQWVTSISDVVPYAIVVAMVVAGTAVALWRRPALGFLGAWFLAILAPTSLVPGIRQTIVEHRMYLALAPVTVVLVLGLHALLRRRVWPVLLALAVGGGWLTAQRNRDYRSDLALWRDTVAQHPGNSGPHLSLGDALFERGQPAAALAQFEEALRLSPGDADAYYNAANALVRLGRMDEAIGHYQAALQLRSDYFDAHTNLGEAFMRTDRFPEAVKQYEAAVLLEPELPEAYYNLGNALDRAGRLPAAIRELQRAVRLRPDYSEAHNNLGNLFTRVGNMAAAAGAIRGGRARRSGQRRGPLQPRDRVVEDATSAGSGGAVRAGATPSARFGGSRPESGHDLPPPQPARGGRDAIRARAAPPAGQRRGAPRSGHHPGTQRPVSGSRRPAAGRAEDRSERRAGPLQPRLRPAGPRSVGGGSGPVRGHAPPAAKLCAGPAGTGPGESAAGGRP